MEEKELNENLKYYELFKAVPDTAKKKIQGGKLKGFTDINPMWRIKKLTEVFGICGIGWKAPIKEIREIKGAYDEVVVSMRIELQVCVEGCWSDPIEGIGGSMLINTEKGDLVDRFRHRIMIPICDENGSVIAFGARAIDSNQNPKYLNSPDTVLYNKSRILYGIDVAKNKMIEGPKDIQKFYASLARKGFDFSTIKKVVKTVINKDFEEENNFD